MKRKRRFEERREEALQAAERKHARPGEEEESFRGFSREEFPGQSDAASANECTGLMYRVPMNDGELESYQELSPMAVPKQSGMEDSVQSRLSRAETAQEVREAVEAASGGEDDGT